MGFLSFSYGPHFHFPLPFYFYRSIFVSSLELSLSPYSLSLSFRPTFLFYFLHFIIYLLTSAYI